MRRRKPPDMVLTQESGVTERTEPFLEEPDGRGAPASSPARVDIPDFRLTTTAAIRPNPLNPRKAYPEDSLREMAESIRAHGILQPLLVRPIAGADGVEFEIIFGERRWRGARLLEQEPGVGISVPIRVLAATDASALRLLLVENLKRQDLGPLEEAEGYARLRELDNADVEAIADEVGKSVSYVYQRLKLLDLVDAAKREVEAGTLSAGHAVLIARLQPDDQKEALTFAFRDSRAYDDEVDIAGYLAPAGKRKRARVACSVRELAGWIGTNLHLALREAPFSVDDAELVPAAGACTACPKRTGFQPELFPEIKRSDICTDRACHQGKVSAHLARQRAHANTLEEERAVKEERKPAPVLEVSTADYIGQGELERGAKKPLTTEHYRPATTKCANREPAVVVHTGYREGGAKLGDTLQVCRDPKCKAHGGREDYDTVRARGQTQRKAEAKKRQAQAKENQARAHLLGLVVSKAETTDYTIHDYRLLGTSLAREMHHDDLKLLCKSRGLEGRGKGKGQSIGWNPRRPITKALEAASLAELRGWLVELAGTGTV